MSISARPNQNTFGRVVGIVRAFRRPLALPCYEPAKRRQIVVVARAAANCRPIDSRWTWPTLGCSSNLPGESDFKRSPDSPPIQ